MNSQSITPFYLDKALWVSLLGMVLPPLSQYLGLNLSSDKIAALVVLVLGYVAAHKVKSGAVLLAEIKSKALQAVTEPPSPSSQSGVKP